MAKHPLDNPIWNSLCAGHSVFAVGNGLARCYPADIGPLSGLAEQTREAYEALRALAGHGGVLVQFLEEPPLERPGWTVLRSGRMTQMIYEGVQAPPPGTLSAQATFRLLTPADVPAMVQLAELTEPGPFRAGTCRLGAFFGIFESDRLVAMAGQRTRPAGFIEVSAVCTHPDARGRGYASTLMSIVMANIFAQGATPYLHAFADNYAAIRVYKALGFVQRRELHLLVLRNDL